MVRVIFILTFVTLTSGLLGNNSFAHGLTSPEQAINSYIKAVSEGSAEHIEMASSTTASIQYYNGQDEFKQYTRDEFAKLVGTGNKWDAKIEITQMKVTGKAANATVEFTWGDKNQHGYVDYLNLIHDGKSWHITDKVAQYLAR